MQAQKADNSTILDALSDVFHGSLLAKLPFSRSSCCPWFQREPSSLSTLHLKSLAYGNKIVVTIVVFYFDKPARMFESSR